ncbi:hypothetical protein [Methanoregula sp.]|jgi:hypothetical protein|uniref:hypothetical protein n=1 Tax=Methanoregula sp. TaxID=2052170 RepID=UPI003C209F80
MTGIPCIQPADVTKTYPPESGDVTAPDQGSHDLRENDFVAIGEIPGNLHKDGKAPVPMARDPAAAAYARRTLRSGDGRIAEEP